MLFGHDRDELRRMYRTAWHKAQGKEPLSALETQIAGVIGDHPEYHALLSSATVDADFLPEDGQENPFLHMGLHLALRDQVKTGRPPEIAALYARIVAASKDIHTAEHRMIDCLAETLWESQKHGRPPDERIYLERLRKLLR
jgi:hypothetical protein